MRNKASLFYLALLLISILTLRCVDGNMPRGTVTISIEEYDSLRAGAIIKEVPVPIPPDYDSVNSFWQGKFTSEIFALNQKADSIDGLLTSAERTITNMGGIIDSLSNLPPVIEYRDTGSVVVRDTCTSEPSNISYALIFPDTVKVDTTHPNFADVQTNLLDDRPYVKRDTDKGTRWATAGYPHWAVFQFNEPVAIDSMEINIFAWDEGYTHDITVWSWGDSIKQITTKNVLWSGHSLNLYTSQIALRVDGGQNGWTDLGGVRFYKKVVGE